MLENIVTTLANKISIMDSDFVGSKIVYIFFWSMMQWTFQKFLENLYFVKKNVISIALAISHLCLPMGKRLENFNGSVRPKSKF